MPKLAALVWHQNLKSIKMKFLLSFGAILFTLGVHAQAITPDYAKAFSEPVIGIKGGVNLNNQNIGLNADGISLNLNTKNYTSLHFGLFAQFMMSEKWAIQPELLYSAEGATISLDVPTEMGVFPLEVDQKLNFLKLPVLFKFLPFNNGLFVYAGPQMGILLDDEVSTPNEEGSVELFESAFDSFELSGVVGAEYFFSKSFLIGGRYTAGLSDISNTEGASLKGETIQFYLGIKLF